MNDLRWLKATKGDQRRLWATLDDLRSQSRPHDSQDCTLLKTQTRGNNVPTGLSSAKVRTADLTTSSMLCASAPDEQFQSFYGCGTNSTFGGKGKNLSFSQTWMTFEEVTDTLVYVAPSILPLDTNYKYCEHLRPCIRQNV